MESTPTPHRWARGLVLDCSERDLESAILPQTTAVAEEIVAVEAPTRTIVKLHFRFHRETTREQTHHQTWLVAPTHPTEMLVHSWHHLRQIIQFEFGYQKSIDRATHSISAAAVAEFELK